MERPSDDREVNWKRNDIQFARLISELNAAAAFDAQTMAYLSTSMGLTEEQIGELVDRAEEDWEWVKQCQAGQQEEL
jgi:hypothetical protein